MILSIGSKEYDQIDSFSHLVPLAMTMSIKKFLFLLCFCINTFFSHAADSISANQTLSGNQTIVSSGGNFELGFFTPGQSSKYYIGIWYKYIDDQTVTWVANRETPILNKNSAQLKILDGNLVLLNESQAKIWSTDLNSTASSNSVFAVVLDNGNLVLREGSGPNSSVGQPLWESFYNPTDTWMPGAKIGYNKRTKQKQILTSWKNYENPAPGLFSLELDPNGSQCFLMWNRSKKYWASGSLNDYNFSLVRAGYKNYIFNFGYVDNENESYFTYSIIGPSISRILVDSWGMYNLIWFWRGGYWNTFWSQPTQRCDVYAYCGAFSVCSRNGCNCLPGFKVKSQNDGACVREINLQCENNVTASDGRKDKFMMNSNVRLPENSQSLRMGSIGECESACLSNCSCTAYAYGENGCSVWNGKLLNLQQLAEGDSSGKTIYIRLSASSSVFQGTKNDNKNGKKNDKGVVIGAIAGSVAVVLVLLAVILAIIWIRHRRTIRVSEAVEGSLVVFGYKDLQNATKRFSEKLGAGGFGVVFKGTLPDSTVIAVKKLESISHGDKQFRAEVSTIGMIQHVNLVRLRGFCTHGNKKLLVYDCMENGSLASQLFHANESKVLKWKTRYQIALGVARGLAYLHEKCRDCIIHCDIKPENVLLDAEFCPKVADFGLAKLVGRDFSKVLTTFRGTIGYLAPEWISGVAVTAKVDVYSYGMMLFELVSGRRNSTHSTDENVGYFPSLAARVTIEGDDVLGLLDPSVDGDADVEEVFKMCKVACWCIQGDANIRPSMGQVVQILEGLVDVNLPPIPRWLEVLEENLKDSVLSN